MGVRPGQIRDAAAPEVGAIACDDGTVLRALAAGGRLFAADLSLGSWRGQALASDLAGQLGMAIQTVADAGMPEMTSNGPPSYAALIGEGIDCEAMGDTLVVRAFALARTLARAFADLDGPATIAILAPRWGEAWGRDNELLLRFLARMLAGTKAELLIACAADATLPDGWPVHWRKTVPTAVAHAPETARAGLLSLVPGLVNAALALDLGEAASLGACIGLPNGWMLVPPEWRRPPTEVSRLKFDKLAARARSTEWLNAYGRYRGSNVHADPINLAATAWRHRSHGGVEVALRLLDRACTCATVPAQRAALECQRQGMRIGCQRYTQAAVADDPPVSAAAPVRAFLYEAKGWGLAMTGRGADALEQLRHAEALLPADGLDLERLYLENIKALALLRSGDEAAALASERGIAARLAELGAAADNRLVFVNALNTARLYLRRGDRPAACASFERAFDTTRGLRSANDTLQAAVYRTRLAAAGDGLAAWLRAALCFLANDLPESIGRRTASVLLRTLPRGDEFSRVEAMAEALEAELRAAARRVGLTPEDDVPVIPFRAAPLWRQASVAGDLQIVGAPGWVVGVSSADCDGPRFGGPAHNGLAHTVLAIMRRIVSFEVPALGCILVPDRGGCDLPTTLEDAREIAVRLAACKVGFGQDVVVPDAVAVESFSVRLSDGVAETFHDTDGAVIRYRRLRPPVYLEGDDARLLAELGRTPVPVRRLVAAAANPDGVVARLIHLEAMRIVALKLPQRGETDDPRMAPSGL